MRASEHPGDAVIRELRATDRRYEHAYTQAMGKTESRQYITDGQGNKKSVVLPVKTYEELLEDIQDLAAVAERRDEKCIPFDDIISDLKKV